MSVFYLQAFELSKVGSSANGIQPGASGRPFPEWPQREPVEKELPFKFRKRIEFLVGSTGLRQPVASPFVVIFFPFFLRNGLNLAPFPLQGLACSRSAITISRELPQTAFPRLRS